MSDLDRVLPVEVLDLIFLSVAGDEDILQHEYESFLLSVAQVSSYWRAAALSATHLWWRINIIPTSLAKSRSWLERASFAPVSIRCSSFPSSSSDFLEEAIHLISLHTFHCRRLMLIITDTGLPNPFGPLVAVEAPILRDLYVIHTSTETDGRINDAGMLFCGQTPSLRNVLSNGVDGHIIPLSNLTSLSFWAPEAPLDLHFPRILLSCINMTCLRLYGILSPSTEGDFETANVTQLPNLKHLQLTSVTWSALVHFLKRTFFPNIMTLDLTTYPDPDLNTTAPFLSPQTTSFPCLTAFTSRTLPARATSTILDLSPNLKILNISFPQHLDPFLPSLMDIIIPNRHPSLVLSRPRCPQITSFGLRVSRRGLGVDDLHRLVRAYVPYPFRAGAYFKEEKEEVREDDRRLEALYAGGIEFALGQERMKEFEGWVKDLSFEDKLVEIPAWDTVFDFPPFFE